MKDDFFDLLVEMIIDEGITERQLIDSIKHVLKTFHYKELTIANILSFDKRIKLYTYSEVCALVTSGKFQMSDFQIKEIGEEVFRVLKKDLI